MICSKYERHTSCQKPEVCCQSSVMIGLFVVSIVFLNSVICDNCTKEEFTCKSGQCVALSGVCNDAVHCEDFSDENCDGGTICPEGLYRCSNGFCQKMDAGCDGIDDCADGSDENNCGWEVTSDNVYITSTSPDLETSPTLAMPSSTLHISEQMTTAPLASLSSKAYDLSTSESPVTTLSTTPKDGVIPIDNNDENKDVVLIGGIVGGLVLLAIILLVVCYSCRHSRSKISKGAIDINGINNNEEMKSTHPDYPINLSCITRPISYSKLADCQLAPQGEINYSIGAFSDDGDIESSDYDDPNDGGFYI